MKMNTIKALLIKDVKLFTSNRFYVLITAVGLLFFVALYLILPSRTDEKLNLAVYAPEMPPAFAQIQTWEGLGISYFKDEDSLRQAVLDGEYEVALSLPPDIMDTWAAGNKPTITMYSSSLASPEIKAAIIALVKEMSYTQTGQELNLETSGEILGPDMQGQPISLRDRLRPLLAVFILLMEILSLSSLIAVEIEQGTARALLMTPLRVSHLFLAKGILGIGLTLGQSVLFMALVGGFNQQPLIILVTLLLGSAMVVGLGFLVASLTRDVTAVTGWGMLVLILLAVPGFGAAIPGLISGWARVIPSFYLTDTVSRVANYSSGWGDVGLNLAVLAAFTAAVIGAGMAALRRRYL